MEFKGFRIRIIILVFVVVLGVALSGQKLTHHHRVITPLLTGFQSVDGVEKVLLEETRIGAKIILELAEVSDLALLTGHIRKQASTLSMPHQLLIQDKSSVRLDRIYHEMHFVIEQAVVVGDFQDMAKVVAQIAELYTISHQIRVDSDYVYVQLHDDGNYYYQIISRSGAPKIRRLVS